MLTTSDFKRGLRVLMDGEPYAIEDYTVQTPSARGAATLVRTKMRNIITGTLQDRTFKSGEKFDEPDVQFRQIQFLYDDGEGCNFMDVQSYDQFSLPREQVGEAADWLTEGLTLSSVIFNGKPVGVSLPQFVEAEIEMVGGGARGDTQSGKNLKDATLTNGRTVKVPLFVEAGEKILVDTRTWEFSKRAPK
ncbi:MAG: elongation factor P [Acidobacteriia bacterium]|nr:elongation factor P [Terriglobia bacterium]